MLGIKRKMSALLATLLLHAACPALTLSKFQPLHSRRATCAYSSTPRERTAVLSLVKQAEPVGAEAVAPKGQQKAKTKTDRFELRFDCNICEKENKHSISRHAYTKGTVLVTCPMCNSTHLIADNLNWIENDFHNLEEFMAKRGQPVTRVVRGGADVDAAQTIAEGSTTSKVEQPRVSRAEERAVHRIDGISEDQALRIHEAVRAHKRRRAQEVAGDDQRSDSV